MFRIGFTILFCIALVVLFGLALYRRNKPDSGYATAEQGNDLCAIKQPEHPVLPEGFAHAGQRCRRFRLRAVGIPAICGVLP